MEQFNKVRCVLGESPIWHPIRQRFYWVDIVAQKLFSLSEHLSEFQTWTFKDKIACIVPSLDGQLLAALSRQIIHFNLDTGEVLPLTSSKLIGEQEMFNDGKVDSKGRFWIGTKDVLEAKPLGKLYCFDGVHLEVKDEGFTVSNGLDWSLDNTKMYFTDSPERKIYQYDVDEFSGEIGNRQVFITVERGYPDGLTVDALGNIWGAHWDGHCISCYSPNGELIERIETEVQRPTSCCFGGGAFDQLLFTSASRDLPQPLIGNGFTFIQEAEVKGRGSFPFFVGKNTNTSWLCKS